MTLPKRYSAPPPVAGPQFAVPKETDFSGEFGEQHAELIRTWHDGLNPAVRGVRDAAVRDKFGLSSPRAAQVVNSLLGRPEARTFNGGEVAPEVERLISIRERRRTGRTL